jgi:hypothetical protein
MLEFGGEDTEIVHGSQAYSMKANWTLLVENSMDGYHALPTHQRYFDQTIDSGGSLGTLAKDTGKAGDVSITVAEQAKIDMSVGAQSSVFGIGSATAGAGKAGNVSVTAGALAITNSGEVASYTTAAGDSGDVSVKISGMLSIDGLRGTPGVPTAIFADSLPVPGSGGNAGKVTITAGSLSIANTSAISSNNGATASNPSGPRNAGGSQSPRGA